MAEKLEVNPPNANLDVLSDAIKSWSEQRMQSLGAPPRRNLKLSLSQPKPKASLRLTIGSSTPTPTLVGGTIDSESLRRQKEEMGQALSRTQRASSKPIQANGSTPVPSSTAPSIRRSVSLATEQPDGATIDVNNPSTPQSQEIPRISQAPTTASLPSPVKEIETPGQAAPLTNGIRHHEAPLSQPSQTALISQQSVIPFERHFRDPGKGTPRCLFTEGHINLFIFRFGVSSSGGCHIHDQSQGSEGSQVETHSQGLTHQDSDNCLYDTPLQLPRHPHHTVDNTGT